jgi:hypothetical protein
MKHGVRDEPGLYVSIAFKVEISSCLNFGPDSNARLVT